MVIIGCDGVGVLGGFGVVEDPVDGQDTQDKESEFIQQKQRHREEHHRNRVGGCEQCTEYRAHRDGMFAPFTHDFGIEDADPSEHDDDDGGLECDTEGHAHIEQGFDVFGDSVLLENPGLGGELGDEDFGTIFVVAEVHALLHQRFVDPVGPDGWVDGVCLEDGDGGQDDALGEWGDGDGVHAGDFGVEPDEESEDHWQNHEVEKQDAQDGEDSRKGNEEVGDFAFVGVEAWGNELPELDEYPRCTDEYGDDEGDLDDGAEGFKGACCLEYGGLSAFVEFFECGFDEDFEDGASEEEGDGEDGQESDKGKENAFAEVVEVVAEAHDGWRVE